jgi:DNA modification methylase
MSIPRDGVIHGDCIEHMKSFPHKSVDFILTDPPYITRHRSRDNQTVRNDDNTAWLAPSFAEMYRVLKPDACAVSFYGWNKVDLFFQAWKQAGFRIGGHIIFRKRYASNARYLEYRHEAAYLLIKGTPALPAAPLPDVMDWTYTGNRLHPTQKSIAILKPIIEAFSKRGDLILDPFAGSGSTCVAAQQIGRAYIGIELDPTHHRTACSRVSRERRVA